MTYYIRSFATDTILYKTESLDKVRAKAISLLKGPGHTVWIYRSKKASNPCYQVGLSEIYWGQRMSNWKGFGFNKTYHPGIIQILNKNGTVKGRR